MPPPKRSRSKLYDIQSPVTPQQIENINANFDRLFSDLYAADLAALYTDDILQAEWGGTGHGLYAIGDLLYADSVTTLARLAAGASGYSLVSAGAGTAPVWTTRLHNLLSAIHPDTLADSVVRGDVLIGNSTPKWARLGKGTSGYALIMDATDPAWRVIPTQASELLSSVHTDTTVGTVVRGDLIAGIGATPKWTRVAKGTSGYALIMGADEPAWTVLPTQTSALLSAVHTDTTAAAVVRGDLIAGIGVTPKWERLAKGTSGYALLMGSDEPAWGVLPTQTSALLSAVHTDTTAAAVVRGDLIAGIGATPKWARLAKGSSGTVLGMGADDPAWMAVPAHDQNASTIIIPTGMGTPSYNDVQDWLNYTQSSGRITGGVLTAHAGPNGTLDISEMEGMIHTANTLGSPLIYFKKAAVASIALTDLAVNYIWITYTEPAGVPTLTYSANAARPTEDYNVFVVGRCYRNGNTVEVVTTGQNIYNQYGRQQDRMLTKYGAMDHAQGGILTAHATPLQMTVSNGIWYFGNSRIDTTGGSTFKVHYRSGSATWLESGALTLFSDIFNGAAATVYHYYQNGTTLTALPGNNYGVYWVFVDPAGDRYVILGTSAYANVGLAQAATVPTVLPPELVDWSRLIGRIIIKDATAAFYSVESSFTTQFTLSAATDHASLANLTAADAHPASSITFTPNGTIAAVTAQLAIQEVRDEAQPVNTNLTSLAALAYVSTSFVKMTAAGTFGLDTATYLASGGTAVDSDKLDGLHGASYSPVAGSSSLVTTGTVTTGGWNAGAVTSSGVISNTLSDGGPGDNAYAASFTNLEATAGRSFGLLVTGGTNSGDFQLYVRSTAAIPSFVIQGDGVASSGPVTEGTGANILPTLRLRGYNQISTGSDAYGNYGGLILHSSAGYTANARHWLITNALNLTDFAIIRSTSATADPVLGTAGALSSGTADLRISYTGAATFASTLECVGAEGLKVSKSGSYVTLGCDVTNALLQSWSNQPLYLNKEGNDVKFGNAKIVFTTLTGVAVFASTIQATRGTFTISDSGDTAGLLLENTSSSGYTIARVNRSNTIRSAQLSFATGGTTDWNIGLLYNSGTANSGFSIQATSSDIASIASVGPAFHIATSGTATFGGKVIIPGSTTDSTLKVGALELQSYAVNNCWLGDNVYYDGSFRYRVDGYMTQIYSSGGVLTFKTAASGTAGNAVTPTTQLTIDNLGVATFTSAVILGVHYIGALNTVALSASATNQDVHLATIANNCNARFVCRAAAANAEDMLEFDVIGTYIDTTAVIRVKHQSYNARFIAIYLVGASGYDREVWVRVYSDSTYPTTVTWRVAESKTVPTIVNTAGTIGTPAVSYVLTGAVSTAVASAFETNGALSLSTDNADKLTTPHWTNPSDEALKDEIADLPDALTTILALRGRTFGFKDKHARPGKHIGFVAQEVETAIPDWVRTGPDGLKTVTIGCDTALFVEAIRELHARVIALEARIH